MEYLFIIIIVFVILFISYLINKKRNRLGLNKALKFIDKKYDINMNEKRVNKLSRILVYVNTFIISVPLCLLLTDINSYLVIGLSFVWFILAILIIYNLIGIILRKKWK